MKNYDAFAQEADRLCKKLLVEDDEVGVTQKLLRMQEKMDQSNLTVYQKEFIMQELQATRAAIQMHMSMNSSITSELGV